MISRGELGLAAMVGLYGILGGFAFAAHTIKADVTTVYRDRECAGASLLLADGATVRLGGPHGRLVSDAGGSIPGGWYSGPLRLCVDVPLSAQAPDNGPAILLLTPHRSERFQ